MQIKVVYLHPPPTLFLAKSKVEFYPTLNNRWLQPEGQSENLIEKELQIESVYENNFRH